MYPVCGRGRAKLPSTEASEPLMALAVMLLVVVLLSISPKPPEVIAVR